MNWRAAMAKSLEIDGRNIAAGNIRGGEEWQGERRRPTAPDQALRLLDCFRSLAMFPPGDPHMRVFLAFAAFLASTLFVDAETPLTVERLLAEGWEIAGFASGYDNRTSLILFRHPGQNALVQCGILFDVTRNPHTIVNCYELR